MAATDPRTIDVEVAEVATCPAAVVRGSVEPAGLPDFLGGAFDAVLRALADQSLQPAGPPFARYRMTGGGFDVEAGFPASAAVRATGRVVPAELPGGTVATTLHRGGYDLLGATYAALGAWLGEHGYETAGDPWESYLDEPGVPVPRTLVAFSCRRR